MENVLKQVPKPLLVLTVISIGIAFIYFSNPPRSICDTEKEAFQETLKGELYPERISKKQGRMPPQIKNSRSLCKQGNSSGACYEYFNMLKNISQAIKHQTTECYATIIEAPGVLPSLKEGAFLMIQLAWGEQPPEDNTRNWFSRSDLTAFCSIKDILKESMEEEDWADFHSQLLESLPGPKPSAENSTPEENALRPKAVQVMGERQVFQKSLLSLNCRNYL